MNKYNVGDIVTGKVTGIENYGIFVSVDGSLSGLIHISEISNSYVRNINDYAEMDEVIKARVIEHDEESNNLKLSVKNLQYRERSKYSHKIVETKGGFSGLNAVLDDWINDKFAELFEKDEKN